MDCENYFCVYQDEGKCILSKISLDIDGKCQECIYVNIDEEYLNEIKKEQLKRL